jgi:hypothetical protein
MVVSHVEQGDIAIPQHFIYVCHVLLDKNQTQLELVVYCVKTENGCMSCEDGKYSYSSSNNLCIICPNKQKPNSNKDNCTSCKEGEYNNLYTDGACDVFLTQCKAGWLC